MIRMVKAAFFLLALSLQCNAVASETPRHIKQTTPDECENLRKRVAQLNLENMDLYQTVTQQEFIIRTLRERIVRLNLKLLEQDPDPDVAELGNESTLSALRTLITYAGENYIKRSMKNLLIGLIDNPLMFPSLMDPSIQVPDERTQLAESSASSSAHGPLSPQAPDSSAKTSSSH